MINIQRTKYYPASPGRGDALTQQRSLHNALFTLLSHDLVYLKQAESSGDKLKLTLRAEPFHGNYEIVEYSGTPEDLACLTAVYQQAVQYSELSRRSRQELIRQLTLPDGTSVSSLPPAQFAQIAQRFNSELWRPMAVLAAFNVPLDYTVIERYLSVDRLEDLAFIASLCQLGGDKFIDVERVHSVGV